MNKIAIQFRKMLEIIKDENGPIAKKIVNLNINDAAYPQVKHLFGGAFGTFKKQYKPKNLIKTNVKNIEDFGKQRLLNQENTPSLDYNHHKLILDHFNMKPGKIYLTKGYESAISSQTKIPDEYSSKRINSMLTKFHELSETTSKRSLGGFVTHNSPSVIINENNILSTLSKHNPGQHRSIGVVKDQYRSLVKEDPARQWIEQYVKKLRPNTAYGDVKIPKAMRKHIDREYHDNQKLVLGTE